MTETASNNPTPARKKRGLQHVSAQTRQRWGRRTRHRWALAIARRISRWQLPKRERKLRAALVDAFNTVRFFAQRNEHGRLAGTATMFNIGLYMMLAQRDIQAVKIDALTHPDEWVRKLMARIILLTIYEWDAGRVTGIAFKNAMELMLIPQELRDEANASVRRLRHIQEKARREFSEVRNAAIAHRDPNALVQYRAIRDLDEKQVWEIAARFFSEISTFMNVQTRIMGVGNTFQSYIRQRAEYERRTGKIH